MYDRRDYADLSELIGFTLLQLLVVVWPLNYLHTLEVAALFSGLLALAFWLLVSFLGDFLGKTKSDPGVSTLTGECGAILALLWATDSRMFVWIPALFVVALCVVGSIFFIRRAVKRSDNSPYRTALEDRLQEWFFSAWLVGTVIDAYLVSINVLPRQWHYNGLFIFGCLLIGTVVPYLVLLYNAKTAYYNRLRRPEY